MRERVKHEIVQKGKKEVDENALSFYLVLTIRHATFPFTSLSI